MFLEQLHTLYSLLRFLKGIIHSPILVFGSIVMAMQVRRKWQNFVMGGVSMGLTTLFLKSYFTSASQRRSIRSPCFSFKRKVFRLNANFFQVISQYIQIMINYLANWQYLSQWEKSGNRRKSWRPPTFSIHSPVQPPLGLMFDIFIFSYQMYNFQTIKKWQGQHQKTKDLQTHPMPLRELVVI